MENLKSYVIAVRTMALVAIMATVFGCGKSKSPKLQEPLETFQPTTMQAGQLKFDVKSKADILIVVDNSLSMEAHQLNLANNIDKFVSAFSKNTLIDYHIGVVPVYDSVIVRSGKYQIHPAGQLVPLQDQPNELFATQETPNMLESLKKTIFMGTVKGPEYEESFSPVLAALSPEVNKINHGFYRKDAYLAIIFITDADDGTPELTASEFYKRLLVEKNNDRSKILASAALSFEKGCPRDPGYTYSGPTRILEFLRPRLADGVAVDLCSAGFGQKLSDFGNQFAERVGRKILDIPELPDIDSLNVTYGSQTLKKSPIDGWSYVVDESHNQIILNGKIEVKPEAGAQVEIHYIPLNLPNEANGRIKVIGGEADQ